MIQRKQFFVLKGLQTRFIGTVFLIIALVFVVMACNLYFFGIHIMELAGEERSAAVKAVIDLALGELQSRLLLLVLVNLLIVAMISLLFSHQIAGPLYKLDLTLRKIVAGDLGTRFSFRASDRLENLAWLLNELRRGLNTALIEMRQSERELSDRAAQLEANAGNGAKVKELAGEIGSISKRLGEAHSGYKIDDLAGGAEVPEPGTESTPAS